MGLGNRQKLDRIGAIMVINNIPVETVSGDITNVRQAVQYIHQKMKLSTRYSYASDKTGTVIVGASGAALGTTLGPAGVVGGAAIGFVAGEAFGGVLGHTSNLGLNKIARASKAAWKYARGTKGVHRSQASDVLVTYAFRWFCNRSSADRLGKTAYDAVVTLFGDREAVENLLGSPDGSDALREHVAQLLKS